MLITCPSCGGAFEMSEAALGVKATVPCPLCARIVVVRDAQVVPPGKEDGTVPYDPGTEAAVEPVEPATDVAKLEIPALPAGKRVSLAILEGPRQGDILRIDRPRVLIGRAGGGQGAQIEIPDSEMSRAHAVVECLGGRFVLRDKGSSNGTWVGDERIESRELDDRSEFRLGGTRFMLIVADSE